MAQGVSIDAELDQLHDRIMAMADRNARSEWIDATRSVRGWFASHFDGSAKRFSPSAEADDPAAGASAAAALGRSGGKLFDAARTRGKSVAERLFGDAALSGYVVDQKGRASAYDDATEEFVSVSYAAPDDAERDAVRGLPVNGAGPAIWAEVLATQLWAGLIGAVGRRVSAETGGWESAMLAMRGRIAAAFDRFEADAVRLAGQFFMAGVALSARQVAEAFASEVVLTE